MDGMPFRDDFVGILFALYSTTVLLISS